MIEWKLVKTVLKKLDFAIINRHITLCFVFNVGDRCQCGSKYMIYIYIYLS